MSTGEQAQSRTQAQATGAEAVAPNLLDQVLAATKPTERSRTEELGRPAR